MELTMAVMWCFAVVIKLSRTPVGTEHLLCFIPSEFANFLLMKFMLEPVYSNALARIVCALLFKI
jgi:hypothetical protein